ncbi:hypothetical protein D3C74_432580 [compost metagenome]
MQLLGNLFVAQSLRQFLQNLQLPPGQVIRIQRSLQLLILEQLLGHFLRDHCPASVDQPDSRSQFLWMEGLQQIPFCTKPQRF